jgi:hypothetical protein
MIRLIAFAAFALAAATSAQAMSAPPLHKLDGISTETQNVGYRYRGVGRGYGYRGYNRYGYGGYRRYGYSGYNRYGYGGYRRYGYRPYAYQPYAYRRPYAYQSYAYRPYAYRPYGYGVARGIARRNIRRGIIW